MDNGFSSFEKKRRKGFFPPLMPSRRKTWARHRPIINNALQAIICGVVLIVLLFLVLHNLHHETVCPLTNLDSDFAPVDLREFGHESCESGDHKKHKLCGLSHIPIPRLLKHCHQSQYGNYTINYGCSHPSDRCNNTLLFQLLEEYLPPGLSSLSDNHENSHGDDDDDDDNDDNHHTHHKKHSTATMSCPNNSTTPIMMVKELFTHPTYPIHNSEGINTLLPYFCQFILTDLLEFRARKGFKFSVEEITDIYTRNVSATRYLQEKSHHDNRRDDDDEERDEQIESDDPDYYARTDRSFQPLSSQNPLIDASMIYGSSRERNAQLREYKLGRMRVSFPKHGVCAGLEDDKWTPLTGTESSDHSETNRNMNSDTGSDGLNNDDDDDDDQINYEYGEEVNLSKSHRIHGDEHHKLQRICSLPPRTEDMTCEHGAHDTVDDDDQDKNEDKPQKHKKGLPMFECGDTNYCNDNIGLLSLHTLFLRNHNFWAAYFHKSRPNWDDEMLYQMSRALVIAELQHITYRHLLPALFGEDINTIIQNSENSKQSGQLCYDPKQDPRPYAELFSIFRMHSMIPEEIYYRNEHHPYQVTKTRSLDVTQQSKHETHQDLIRGEVTIGSILLGMIHNSAEEQDMFISHPLSNVSCNGHSLEFGNYVRHSYLRNIAESVGQDRELGFSTFSNLYWKVNGKTISGWEAFVDDSETVQRLRAVYGDYGWNSVDLWVGVIAEKHYSNSLFGKTAHKFVKDQFLRAANADWYFYTQNAITIPFLSRIFATHPEHILERNTNISFQKDYHKTKNIFHT